MKNDLYMETKELKITIPEGQEIDWQESTKQEKIVFKKKENTTPRSWKEYCNNYVGKVFYIYKDSTILGGDYTRHGLYAEGDKNTLPTKELAEAFLAMMQLMSLRQAWIGDWEADWNNWDIIKYCISNHRDGDFKILYLGVVGSPLSFPTEEMAEDFMNCFKDLLEIAKPLI